MIHIYNSISHLAWFLLKILALFSKKLKLFVSGREETFTILEKSITKNDDVIWLHAASLGEFEQGRPILERIKKEYPNYKILLTFFSPSGYEVKKNTTVADIVTYLPFDTKKDVIQFLNTTQPKFAIFIKYEVWPNYLNCLQARNIPTFLVSAIFSKEQVYFKWYGGFMKKSLQKFDYIFLQDEKSKGLLSSIGIENTTVSGDTRLDRVSEITERNNQLPLIEAFKHDKLCLVAGSTWAEDEAILISYINKTKKGIKFIIAPHKIEEDKIVGLVASIDKTTTRISNANLNTIGHFDVLIIDNIGMLTKIYNYADISYVGGGFATGLHNTLEPAVFGIPVIIGPDYSGFKEAEELVAKGGIISIRDAHSFNMTVNKLIENNAFRSQTGATNATYIQKNKGASIQIMSYLRKLL